mgnify:CR=1 FL=1
MLVGYVDDSGSHENEYAFVLAGFISTTERWINFSDEWDALSRQYPQTLDFKMKVAERLKGGGTYWGDGTDDELIERRDTKVQALAALIKKHAIYRISAGTDWHNYRAIAKGRVPPEVDSPYFFLYHELIATVANYLAASGESEKIEFIFDQQGSIGDISRSWFSTLIATLPPSARNIITGTPSFKTDTDVLPLKAADMLAWQMRRYVEDIEISSVTEIRPALAALLELPHIHANIPAVKLREIVREVNHVGG